MVGHHAALNQRINQSKIVFLIALVPRALVADLFHTEPFDDAMRIATVLPSHQLNVVRKVLVNDRVIKNEKPVRRRDNLTLYVLSDQPWTDFITQ